MGSLLGILAKYPLSIIYILPHGIFELSAFIIAGAAGFRLTLTIIGVIRDILHIKRNIPLGKQIKEILNVTYLKFRDSLILLAIAIVLIFIAAFIEANLTPILGDFIRNLI